LQEGIFFSRVICDRQGERVEIDSRTSDAIALAIKFQCPIYCVDTVLDEAGYENDEEPESSEETPGRVIHEELIPVSKTHSGFDSFNIDDLENMLEEAIRDEDYSRAAKIRDEIAKRKK
jgi:bifunctional DNase/RNase